jgi:hypothetical protein
MYIKVLEYLIQLNPKLLLLYATLFTWFTKALGSYMAFFFQSKSKKRICCRGRSTMLIFATGHWGNIWRTTGQFCPGMLTGAIIFAIGIGIQNFSGGGCSLRLNSTSEFVKVELSLRVIKLII